MFRYRHYLLALVALFMGAGVAVRTVWAAPTTDARTVNVGFTVPTVGGGNNGGGGGGGGGGNNPPVISNVAISVTANTATISWNATDDNNSIAAVVLEYGQTNIYGQNGTVTGAYQSSLAGLDPNTKYYFKITVTDSGNLAANFAGTFTTEPVGVNPILVISNTATIVGTTTAHITWDTNVPADSQVTYGRTALYGSTASNFAAVLQHDLTLINLLPNTVYHYQISSTDNNGQQVFTNDAQFTTLKDNIPPPDVSDFNAVITAHSIDLSWSNPDSAIVPDWSGVRVVRKTGGTPPANINDGTIIYEGISSQFSDQTAQINTAYSYTAFSYDTSGNYSGGTSISNVKIVSPPPIVPDSEICDNGVDDDGNGSIDCADQACANNQVCVNAPQPIVPPADKPLAIPPGSVGGAAKITLDKLYFLVGNRQIQLSTANQIVHTLTGTVLTVAVPEDILIKKPLGIILVLSGPEIHNFKYNAADRRYYADITVPVIGNHSAYVEVRYSDTENDVIPFTLASEPLGVVLNAGQILSGATVELQNSQGTRVPLENYGEINPVVSNASGRYGWLVPNGNYQLRVTKPGFYTRQTPVFSVTDNMIRNPVELIAEPPPLFDVINPAKSISANVAAVAANLTATGRAIVRRVGQAIADLKKNPTVEKVVGTRIAPAIVGASALGFLSLVSFSNLLPLLRLLFLQPLLLLGRRRRAGWGQVYNALSKLPLSLVTLRLINADNDQLVQTKVTDSKGRYAFVAQPGRYRILAAKEGMLFPSNLLKGFTTDGGKVDIYHGEVITVTEADALVTANIPLDPLGDPNKPTRLRWQKMARLVKIVLAYSGLALTLVSFYLSPHWYVAVLLFIHIILIILFYRLAIPPKIKSWGIVYGADTERPVGRTIARLFNTKFNKLVATQITDTKGRYYFLAADDKYYVTYEHPAYTPLQSNPIDLTGKTEDTVAVDVKLNKKVETI